MSARLRSGASIRKVSGPSTSIDPLMASAAAARPTAVAMSSTAIGSIKASATLVMSSRDGSEHDRRHELEGLGGAGRRIRNH